MNNMGSCFTFSSNESWKWINESSNKIILQLRKFDSNFVFQMFYLITSSTCKYNISFKCIRITSLLDLSSFFCRICFRTKFGFVECSTVSGATRWCYLNFPVHCAGGSIGSTQAQTSSSREKGMSCRHQSWSLRCVLSFEDSTKCW